MTTAEELTRELDEIRASLQTKALAPADLDQLREHLAAIERKLNASPTKPRRNILDLDGLGMEMWRSIDTEEYLKRERDSWR